MIRLLLAAVAVALSLIAAPALARQAAEPTVTAFVRVNLVPMDRARVLRNQTVVVRDGRIAAIGPDLAVPDGARVIDGEGRAWLSPVLADMHVH